MYLWDLRPELLRVFIYTVLILWILIQSSALPDEDFSLGLTTSDLVLNIQKVVNSLFLSEENEIKESLFKYIRGSYQRTYIIYYVRIQCPEGNENWVQTLKAKH